jgi:Lrp/AsnC family transcriptional regulator for asnA, asnC and gidA
MTWTGVETMADKTDNRRTRSLDETDRQLLSLLRDNARVPLTDLARDVQYGYATVHERVHRLVRLGYIRGFHASLEYSKLDLGLVAFVGLQASQGKELRSRMADAIGRIPEVEAMAWVTGELDALVKVRSRDAEHLQEVIYRLVQAGGTTLLRSRTMVVLSEAVSKPGPDFEAITISDIRPTSVAPSG